ncbi:unnamed protein product [Soboliphyme baturini]|uniref:WD_REPEATS_REGION domain-containing protein n=1 Tax=Soboliphyme baturini TaxID=241478 RepID=A0A183J789_9BILA|nr:unnamed protein product [Soboliphyme baturini]
MILRTLLTRARFWRRWVTAALIRTSLYGTCFYRRSTPSFKVCIGLYASCFESVMVWNCHPDGCYCAMYVPCQLSLFTGGKHGELCVWDLRQRQLRHTFKLFEHSSVRCLSLDPSQEFFAAGSSDGDIKIYNLSPVPQLLYSFPGEHSSRGGFSFRQVGTGLSQGVYALHIDQDQRMFSCGADCSFKLRHLCLNRGRPELF